MIIKANVLHKCNLSGQNAIQAAICQEQHLGTPELIAWIERSLGCTWGFLHKVNTSVFELTPFENEALRFSTIQQARSAVGLGLGESERDFKVEVSRRTNQF